MNTEASVAWDGRAGSAGGRTFGDAVKALAEGRSLDLAGFAAAAELDPSHAAAIWAGERRVSVSELARIAEALRLRAFEFLQRTHILSLEVYAMGLDPLYFLPEGQVRKDARIYMREINPRHAVPERDMLKRNPCLQALLADEVLDARGKLEIELAYLLRAAIQRTGGTL
jgi:transcriptional regulator with XRE-family HTH domain